MINEISLKEFEDELKTMRSELLVLITLMIAQELDNRSVEK